MTDSMIERVAAAIKEALEDEATADSYLASEKHFRDLAIAAIKAMWEPTEAMIQGGFALDPLACDVEEHELEYCYGRIWHGMIDAALEKVPA